MSTERRPGTRLPEDEAYWDALAARSIDAAYGRASHTADGASSAMARGATRSTTARAATPAAAWLHAVSDSAFRLAAGAVLALLGGAFLVADGATPATMQPDAIARALAPDDPMLQSLLAAPPDAPAASVLLTLVALREVER